MIVDGILIKGDIYSITDSFKTLKYRSPTDWKISSGYGEVDWWDEYNEMIREDKDKTRQEKLKTLKNSILKDFEKARYTNALVQIDEFLSIVGIDSDPEILKLKHTIESIKTIQDEIRESEENKDFTSIRMYIIKILVLNTKDRSAFKELEFLDKAIPFLDGSILEKIKDSKHCQDSIEQVSELIKESLPFYEGHLIAFNKKLLEVQKEFRRKGKVEDLHHKIKLALEVDDYDAVILCIKEAKKYTKNPNELIFTESQYREAVELKNKISNSEKDHKYKEMLVLLNQLHTLNPYSENVKKQCTHYENYFLLDEAIPVEKDIDEIPVKIKGNVSTLKKLPDHLKHALHKKLAHVISNVRKKALDLAENKQFDPAIEHLMDLQSIEFLEFKKEKIDTEIREIESRKMRHILLKVLKYVGAAAAVIIFVYLGTGPIPNYLNERKIDKYFNEAQLLLAANEFEQLKEKLNQLSRTANKVKNPGKIDDIKNLFENSFNRLMTWPKNHQRKLRYNEAMKHAEKAKKISVMAKKIRGFPVNLTNQWTEKSETRIEELEKKIKSLKFNELIELARLDYENGKYDSAIDKLEEAKKLKPSEEKMVETLLIDVKYEKYLEAGMSYFRQGDYTKAIEHFTLAKEHKSTPDINHMISEANYGKHLELGRSYYQKKDYEKAIEYFKHAKSYKSTAIIEQMISDANYEKHLEAGQSYFKQKDYKKAIEHFENAKKYKSTSTVDEEILKTIKEIRLQELYINLDKYKKSKDTENALKTFMEIKEVNEEPYKTFDLLPQVAYKNSQGYPEIVLRDITFVFIEGGEFEMGCFNSVDRSILKDAASVHRVRLSSFWISRSEITNAQFGKYVKRYELKHPVNYISWTYAHRFSTSFGRQFSLNSNLTTEAQWEYVARNGGKKTVYPWGKEINCQKANYSSCSKRLKPVAQYEPNKFGIFDLSGNVREWCRDVYNKYYYSRSPSKDPVNTWSGSNRVVRGGSYGDGSILLKTYMRHSRPGNSTDKYTGFRIVIER